MKKVPRQNTTNTFRMKKNWPFLFLVICAVVFVYTVWTLHNDKAILSGQPQVPLLKTGGLNLQHSKSRPKDNHHELSGIDTAKKPGGVVFTGGSVFKTKPLVIWSNDFHIGPIADLKHLLRPMGVKFIDQSLSGHCRLTGTCAKSLKVINVNNGINLNHALIPQFYQAYKDDPLMKSVDAFVCFHPTSMCELFMPFNKSLIVIASTRYEMGRHDPKRWQQWNKNLIKIHSDEKNVVGANNAYDQRYVEYFTGFLPELLPSYSGYLNQSYTPSRKGFLLAPIHKGGFQEIFLRGFNAARKKHNSSAIVRPLRAVYPHYKYSDLAAHQGIVYVPYQVSVMSLFEQYRMNIPLFFPSRDLLTTWQYEHYVMTERTWDMVYGKVPSGSPLKGLLPDVPDPNNEKDKASIQYWLQYADFYNYPYITLYDSFEDLVHKLDTANLKNISENMAKYNAKFKLKLVAKWEKILRKIAKHSSNNPM